MKLLLGYTQNKKININIYISAKMLKIQLSLCKFAASEEHGPTLWEPNAYRKLLT